MFFQKCLHFRATQASTNIHYMQQRHAYRVASACTGRRLFTRVQLLKIAEGNHVHATDTCQTWVYGVYERSYLL